ncbi:hypothetical protein ACIPY5_12255 [Microbacterium sp. NPDC089698]|uniref:hypothetical protein n=1 Tax=Microbacterium sp. NPDC089698 TaxID=3364200 RepID=UPI003830E700
MKDFAKEIAQLRERDQRALMDTDAIISLVRRAQAEAIRDARDEIMPPYSCELRPDGSEDPAGSRYVGIMHDVHVELTAIADRIQEEKQ